MLKIRNISLAVLLLVMLFMQALVPNIANAATLVTFPDPNLEAAVRVSIDKPSGDIYLNDVQGIAELDAGGKGIKNIEGIQYLTNLEVLYLYGNDISDISLLKGLTKLQTLGLCDDKVVDISALSGLKELTFLSLYNNKVQDISPLKGLTKLRTLKLANNPITDYSPVYGIYDTLTEKDFTLPVAPNSAGGTPANNGTGDIRVTVDGQTLSFDVAPVNENGRVMVPMRAIFEALGAEIQWNGATNTIDATKDSTTILLTLGKQTATVNGKSVSLAAPAKLINGRTFVPLRFVAEALGCEVNWDAETKLISITSAPPPQATTPSIRVAKDEGNRIAYYINGKLVAEVKVAANGVKDNAYYGDDWVITVTQDFFSYTSKPVVGPGQVIFTYLEKPFSYTCYNGSKGQVLFPTNEWRTDPKIRQDQKDAMEFVLNEIEARNSRLRPLRGY